MVVKSCVSTVANFNSFIYLFKNLVSSNHVKKTIAKCVCGLGTDKHNTDTNGKLWYLTVKPNVLCWASGFRQRNMNVIYQITCEIIPMCIS